MITPELIRWFNDPKTDRESLQTYAKRTKTEHTLGDIMRLAGVIK